jgi:hypothetical protein
MRIVKFYVVALLAIVSSTAFAGVYVSSPGSASVRVPGTANAVSPVHFAAIGTSPSCAKGVASMQIYSAPNVLAYSAPGASISTSLSLGSGTYNVTIQEKDNCGWSSQAALTLTVSSTVPSTSSGGQTFSNIQNTKGWGQYALLPPSWGICSGCTAAGPQLKWSWTQNVNTQTLSGSSVRSAYGGGTVQWGDVLFNNHLIGAFSSQGLPDTGHTLVPAMHSFTYDLYFWVKDASVSQAMEFDINQFTGGKSFIWGHECRIAGGHQWDIYDNVNHKWVPTGVACNPLSGAWNHLTIKVQRTSGNQLVFQSITLNGNTATINKTYSPTSSSWNGITVNYQLDGNRYGTPYTVYLDKVNFTMQ